MGRMNDPAKFWRADDVFCPHPDFYGDRVNPVNTIGVYGVLAGEFARRYPNATAKHRELCHSGEVQLGRVAVIPETNGAGETDWIVFFPTMRAPGQRSEIRDIRSGLRNLADVIAEVNDIGVRSQIAFPAIGCGVGGLNDAVVAGEIIAALGGLDVEVFLCGFSTFGPQLSYKEGN